ncbi:hypothetical protein TRFO_27306 [Tritrichomonas foetus]|uniref:Tetraspanin family protein n=1 Tax=Tritrichomonas foetus TaxID=1144522 RepID=A0A1J4K2T4_9EUKA|nr:hypothetical protein TRFO_27306 [Tritrichomonas foetus]|eukprot:OHT05120.1 hypothetical protein TRFO_27306 [Tritrichomonas foetus]
MGKCCSNTCFGILTLLTIGLTLALFIFATFIYAKIKTANETIFIAIVICLCVSALLFFFGIYASCCGGKCTKAILSIFYIIYAFAIGAAGVLIIVYKSRLTQIFRDAYDQGKFKQADLDAIAETFNCVFPDTESNLTNSTESCFDKFEKYVTKYGLIVGIALLCLFVLLMAGVVLSCKFLCRKDEYEDISAPKKPDNAINTPLTYGW